MFELYPQGKDLFKKRTVSEELEDKLHFFAEECDHLQVCISLTKNDGSYRKGLALMCLQILT